MGYKTPKEIMKQWEIDKEKLTIPVVSKPKGTVCGHVFDTDYHNKQYTCECGEVRKMV